MSKRQLSLGAFFMLPGQHAGAWRDPSTKRENLWNPGYLAELARTAEKGKFDLIFVADGVSAGYTSRAFEYGARVTQFEPLTMFSYLAAVTEKIGFVATASTTYNEPFNLARQFASLDHLSKGRAGLERGDELGEDGAARNFGKGTRTAARPAIRSRGGISGHRDRTVGQLGGRRVLYDRSKCDIRRTAARRTR